MKTPLFFICLLLCACNKEQETINPVVKPITESVYASGNVVSAHQYQAFAAVSGLVSQVYVSEGDAVKIGTPILSIANEAQRLNKENARLSAEFASVTANRGKLQEAELLVSLAKEKMQNDSLLLLRQQKLWAQNIGSKTALEQRELAYQSAKASYFSSLEKLREIKRQVQLSSAQTKNSLAALQSQEADYTLRSMINGTVYGLYVLQGEIVTQQKPLAIIGDSGDFILEMQVDEYDIVRINKGQQVMVALDTHKDSVFEAVVTKINPLMNVQTKTFLVEAVFVTKPKLLLPNITFEANIVIKTKENALLIPRAYLINDSTVVKSTGEEISVKTGLKDYQMIEVLSGLTASDELLKPVK